MYIPCKTSDQYCTELLRSPCVRLLTVIPPSSIFWRQILRSYDQYSLSYSLADGGEDACIRHLDLTGLRELVIDMSEDYTSHIDWFYECIASSLLNLQSLTMRCQYPALDLFFTPLSLPNNLQVRLDISTSPLHVIFIPIFIINSPSHRRQRFQIYAHFPSRTWRARHSRGTRYIYSRNTEESSYFQVQRWQSGSRDIH
jgi:hypothetical protein